MAFIANNIIWLNWQMTNNIDFDQSGQYRVKYHQLMWYNSFCLWRWLLDRLRKRQWLSTTVLLTTTLYHTIIIQPTDKKKIIHKFLSSFSSIYLILTFCCSDPCTRMLLQLRTFSLTRKMLQDHRALGVKDKVIMVQYQYCSKTILSAELIVSLEESFQFLN